MAQLAILLVSLGHKIMLLPFASSTRYSRSSTVVVAASTSRDKKDADIISLGSSDEITIANAIGYLPSGGGNVLLREGIFSLATPVTSLISSLVIQGVGEQTIIKLANAANCRMFNSSAVLTDITFRDITFDGNGSNQSDQVSRDALSMLYLSNITNLKFINCTIKNGRHGACIRLDSCTRVLEYNNQFLNNGINASAFQCDHSYISNSTFFRAVANYYDTCTDTGIAQDGVQYSVVANNVFNNCQSNAITSSSSSTPAPSKEHSIVGNVIKGSGNTADSAGINIYNFNNGGSISDITVIGNVINNCDKSIFLDTCERITLIGNKMLNAAGTNNRHLSFGPSGSTIDKIKIKGNYFYNTPNRGISYEPGTSATNIDIEGNTFDTCTTKIGGTISTTSTIRNNLGYNPQGPAAITVGGSPYTYTAGPTPETVYIRGGVVSDVSKSATTLFAATTCTVELEPNEQVVVTYTVLPTMVKDRH